jgi:hypothetical protein
MSSVNPFIDIGPMDQEGAYLLLKQRQLISKFIDPDFKNHEMSEEDYELLEGLQNLLDVVADELKEKHDLDALFHSEEHSEDSLN